MVKDKVVIITGASQGLGKELSFQLAALEAKIALVSRTKSNLEQVKKEIMAKGGIAEYFVCDVTNQEQVIKTVKAVKDHFGTIDILVNGAGIWTTDELEDKRPELIEQSFKVNSMGPIFFTKAVLPTFKQNNKGHILNIVSKAGTDIPDNKDWPTYTATKWAVAGYTKALSYALADTKIKVSAFYPGGFESHIFETAGEKDAHNQPWMMRTKDVAMSIVFMIDTPDDLQVKSIEVANI
jgi:short-subunit dehydrogenase